MNRILFKKEGRAKFISHLDLMRTMQRVFVRAGVDIRHTEGFNPHPYMVFALPLSVGMESVCELMDFELCGDIPLSKIPRALNCCMPEGITVLEAYAGERKFKDIAYLRICGRMEYDDGEHEKHRAELEELFSRKSIVVEKKTKRGTAEVELSQGVSDLKAQADDGVVTIYATLSIQEPMISPALLIEAVRTHMPQSMPDQATFTRLEIFDKEKRVFR